MFTELIYSYCQPDNQHNKVTNLIHNQYCHWSFQNSCLFIEVAPCIFRKRVPKKIKKYSSVCIHLLVFKMPPSHLNSDKFKAYFRIHTCRIDASLLQPWHRTNPTQAVISFWHSCSSPASLRQNQLYHKAQRQSETDLETNSVWLFTRLVIYKKYVGFL